MNRDETNQTPIVDTVVTSTSEFKGAISIDGSRIVAVGHESAMPAAGSRIDVTGTLVFPGAIDCHVHFDNADTYEDSMWSAARSKITTVVPFATYDIEAQETIPAAIDRLNARLSDRAALDYSLNFHRRAHAVRSRRSA